ncbi:MAG: UDP-4-amino-4-deoxy-L-arabinose-oxoglutarate aminotransferase [Ignavibacteria bacterium RIFOXYB2_FULL_35_12]|nr:MAG: UDP-4-amino-4-deoxy-L-arabinose-oxoglutarate aminotransferase [Ignavibacteria bacterium GWF2_35_20]OGU85773.1 MAG: UDP-4-amino-4-deoxy-L-arabinose-oxoglutarate aminotransferase [Ignavibacteria bacterium RIFOXYA12_FULL_35_25]OGU93144.1 MAG: UDP-4-amino-4-deoxy-L-arabinose-oxoglutarate aminotransferase [Ignavibacteria bacterium RIFOXYB12_FULL_35_14]OGU98300.1 MAG: UDP-4-amino-4-deoxy-L-arabinose-oxoglutarate aminotransferase [Ignavibacteria bacterium RIFOXYC2_FULL_35_16]OGV03342.1 MAG: UD
MNIRLFKPSVGKEELENIKDAFDRSWIGLGPKVNEFEEAWEHFIGCEEAIALNSATAALHLALAVFGFQKSKKVLVPSLTFSSTASAVLYNGLIPVFVDSDPLTLGMSLDDLDEKYNRDCVAIIPVHYCGHPVPMDKIVPWARERDLKIIEDCAHTTGSEYMGKKLGTWGDIGCFSFEEKKLMTTGDGGMIISNDSDLLKNVRAMRWVGIDKDNWKTAVEYTSVNKDALHWFYELSILGYKYNMNDLAASIGLAQLIKLPEMNRRRSEIIKMYLDGIRNTELISPLLPFDPDKYIYQMFGIRAEKRDDLMIFLKSKGIATGCHYTPLSIQPLFIKWGNNCPFIEKEHNHFITLPLHADLENGEVDYIIENIEAYK